MLRIFNELQPFFEDAYLEISVREYARKIKLSPPTASKLLKNFEKESLLISSKKGIYIFFRAKRENSLFKDLSTTYWKQKLSSSLKELHHEFLFKNIILFGSIAKQENTIESDIDLYVDISKKDINLGNIEKKLKRKIQLHFKEVSNNKNLFENIKNGVTIL